MAVAMESPFSCLPRLCSSDQLPPRLRQRSLARRDLLRPTAISIEGGILLGRRFTCGGEQFCPRLVGRFDKSGHFECGASLKRADGRDGM